MSGASFQMLLSKSGGRVETLVDRTLGTNIGNMTLQGGLASAFDGVTNQTAAAGAGTSAVAGYVGKQFAAGKALSRAVVNGSNNVGYVNTGTTTSVTITLFGKNGAPANGTDGTSLGSITFNQSATNESAGRTITSTDNVTTYTNFWVFINGGANSTECAEATFWEMI